MVFVTDRYTMKIRCERLKWNFDYENDLFFNPAISIGVGFINDVNKWAFRPEFGFDGFVSFGIGLNINVNETIKNKKH